jgi:putative glutamine amidotransferase
MATSHGTKPVIGVTRCSRIDDYIASVAQAGGDPLVLETSDDPAAALDRIDGLLLTGGADVDPALYGDTPHPTTEVDAERDRLEVPLSQGALARDLPVLAICRGVQVLNVAAGGSLIQDIPSGAATTLDHAVNEPKSAIAHAVQVTPGSRLASSLAPGTTVASCAVNSRHHQAVNTVAPSFVVSAVSPDGIVEAIERPASTFCLGVQWHPENFHKTGEFAPLFDAFVRACTTKRIR